MTKPAADRPELSWRRWAMLAALVWWGAALAVIPYARRLIDALRQRSLLVLTAIAAAAFLFVAVVAVGALMRRSGMLTARQAVVATASVGVALVLVQFLTRPEERWHALQYGVLGVLLWASVKGEGLKRAAIAILATGACGWLDEGVQFLVPSRVYDLWDAGLNAAAGAVGVGIVEVSRLGGRGNGA